MCEMLGSEPDPNEMPIERSDLTEETQMVLNIYDLLPAKWEGFSGQYLGKDLMLLPVLFDEFDTIKYIRKYAWNIIPVIDSFVAQDIAQKMKRKSKGDASGVGNNSST